MSENLKKFILLEEIAEISLGVLASRGKLIEDYKYEYKLFNIKNYEEKTEISKYPNFYSRENLSDKLSEEEDILYRMSCPNKTVYVDLNLQGLLIPSQLCIIKIKNKKNINPIFLNWYLGSDITNKKLQPYTKGSIIKSISISALKKLEVPIVNKEIQDNIANLYMEWNKEKEISNRLIKEKDKYYTKYMESQIK